MSPPRFVNLYAVLVLAVWLYGTLVLAGRRPGYIIVLIGSILGLIIPILHMRGANGLAGGGIGNSAQAFFFVWTMLALDVTAAVSVILSVCALWPWRRRSS
jgi:hypothetical protein